MVPIDSLLHLVWIQLWFHSLIPDSRPLQAPPSSGGQEKQSQASPASHYFKGVQVTTPSVGHPCFSAAGHLCQSKPVTFRNTRVPNLGMKKKSFKKLIAEFKDLETLRSNGIIDCMLHCVLMASSLKDGTQRTMKCIRMGPAIQRSGTGAASIPKRIALFPGS